MQSLVQIQQKTGKCEWTSFEMWLKQQEIIMT